MRGGQRSAGVHVPARRNPPQGRQRRSTVREMLRELPSP
ncbi:hypothetical protein FM103_17095 [Corynebacterium xerosis]|nr:hypothetical protein FM103_17095 [Corynebacterium xerosis]